MKENTVSFSESLQRHKSTHSTDQQASMSKTVHSNTREYQNMILTCWSPTCVFQSQDTQDQSQATQHT